MQRIYSRQDTLKGLTTGARHRNTVRLNLSLPLPIASKVLREILANRESLPSMPDVAFRIHAAMNSPIWSVSTVAAIIKGDPVTTTYLLQVANSSLYAGITRIAEVELAVARIGVKNTGNLVKAHALRSMFVTNSLVLGMLMRLLGAQ